MNHEYYVSHRKALNSRPEPASLKCRQGNTNIYSQKDAKGRTIQISRPAIVKIKEIE
ncbi:MAG: hypothetical protein K6U80_05875 [Firmicutes bacterium]|nr:hypothetical protein [Bacillota bacterium]